MTIVSSQLIERVPEIIVIADAPAIAITATHGIGVVTIIVNVAVIVMTNVTRHVTSGIVARRGSRTDGPDSSGNHLSHIAILILVQP